MDKQPKRILLDISEVYRQVVPELHRLRLLSVDLSVIFSNVFDAIVEKESIEEGIKAIHELTYQQMEPVLDDVETKNPRIYGFIYNDLEILFRIIQTIAWALVRYMEAWRLYDPESDSCNYRIIQWTSYDVIMIEEGSNFEVNPRADFDCGIYPFHSILTEALEATTVEDIIQARLDAGQQPYRAAQGIYFAQPRAIGDLPCYRPEPTLVGIMERKQDLLAKVYPQLDYLTNGADTPF